MVRRLLAMLALLTASFAVSPASSHPTPPPPAAIVAQADTLPPLFSPKDAAQKHSPRDVVVWLNIPSGINHYKGERWYGRTRHGAYACEQEAIAAGDRASENSQ